MTTNIERAYLTTVSADDLAQAVAENFRAHDFQVQTFRSPDNATVMQTRKDNLWRQAVGTAYAATVIITPGEGHLSDSPRRSTGSASAGRRSPKSLTSDWVASMPWMQIARDSPELHWPIVEILTAFIREHTK
jgi:hypothetical protein